MAAPPSDSGSKSRALVRRSAPSGVDLYERRFMTDNGTVLARAKQKAPPWVNGVMALAPAAALPALMSPAWPVGAAMLTLGAVGWMLHTVMRVQVGTRAVQIQYGLYEPRIPIAQIRSAKVVPYSWAKFGGWGVRRSLDGTRMFNMPGDGGQAVRIEWRNERGKDRVTMIGLSDAEKIASAIREAIAIHRSVRGALPEA